MVNRAVYAKDCDNAPSLPECLRRTRYNHRVHDPRGWLRLLAVEDILEGNCKVTKRTLAIAAKA